MQQHVGYRGIADAGATDKFMGSWTECIGGRLCQDFSTAQDRKPGRSTGVAGSWSM